MILLQNHYRHFHDVHENTLKTFKTLPEGLSSSTRNQENQKVLES